MTKYGGGADPMLGWEIQEEAWRAFDDWLSLQPDEVRDMDILRQIELFAEPKQEALFG